MERILDYEKLVYSIIRKFSYNTNDYEDLFQEGMIALQKAMKNYKEGYNTDFSSYAYLYIKGEILKYIRENKVMKVGKDSIKLNSLINKTKDKLQQHYGRNVTLEEIASFLEIPIEKVNQTIQVNDYIRSLDYVLNDDGKEIDVYDCIGYDEKEYNPIIMDLKEQLSNLDKNDKKLINLRYYEGLTQQETSKIMGMTQVQVSRKENKILMKLNQKLSS
ncbi:MAG: sigma-70 family RNA polymerase sigma factor [bacterium]|nr:sigma-70 family RNA polymerase sigma factor [bacterium]